MSYSHKDVLREMLAKRQVPIELAPIIERMANAMLELNRAAQEAYALTEPHVTTVRWQVAGHEELMPQDTAMRVTIGWRRGIPASGPGHRLVSSISLPPINLSTSRGIKDQEGSRSERE